MRAEEGLDSPHLPERLSTGAVVHGVKLKGDRLHYELLMGTGPASGWVTIKLHNKYLLVTTRQRPHRPPAVTAAPPVTPSLPPAVPARLASSSRGSPTQANASNVAVLVRGLAGEELARVTAAASSTVLALKEELAGICGVPPKQQQLLNGRRILDDNGMVSALGQHAEVQLVKLTEGLEKIQLNIVGAWMLSGTKCCLSVDLKVTLKEVKALIQGATGLQAESFEFGSGEFVNWQDDRETLDDILTRRPKPDTTLTAYIFAREPPERARLREDLASGRISAAEAALLDPDILMPAC